MSANMKVSSTQEVQRSIPMVLSKQQDEALNLKGQIEELHGRLEPILGPPPPVKDGENPSEGQSQSNIALKVVENTNVIEECNAIVAELLSRIEV